MKHATRITSDFIPHEVLSQYRKRSEEGWKQILSMTDVLDKAFVELSLEQEEEKCDPYDTSSRLRKISV